jgi:hypothetical protein
MRQRFNSAAFKRAEEQRPMAGARPSRSKLEPVLERIGFSGKTRMGPGTQADEAQQGLTVSAVSNKIRIFDDHSSTL